MAGGCGGTGPPNAAQGVRCVINKLPPIAGEVNRFVDDDTVVYAIGRAEVYVQKSKPQYLPRRRGWSIQGFLLRISISVQNFKVKDEYRHAMLIGGRELLLYKVLDARLELRLRLLNLSGRPYRVTFRIFGLFSVDH